MAAAPLNLEDPQLPVHVGVILMNSVTEILDVAPVEFFSMLNVSEDFGLPEDMLPPPQVAAQAIDFRFHWVSEAGPPTTVKLTSNITLVPTDSFETCPPLDIVLIGAQKFNYIPTAAELAFVRKAYEDSSAFLTICGGIGAPLLAGLLEGKTATGPRDFLPFMKEQAPGVNWVEKRWVRDGKIWTSGSVLNGTDMMRAFGREVWGGRMGGKGGLLERIERVGAWPARDVEYKDEF